MISQYNVEHCREITGSGPELDTNYLLSEGGVEAIPALIWLKRHDAPILSKSVADLLVAELNYDMRDWRTWSLRQYRLAEILRKNDQGGSN